MSTILSSKSHAAKVLITEFDRYTYQKDIWESDPIFRKHKLKNLRSYFNRHKQKLLKNDRNHPLILNILN